MTERFHHRAVWLFGVAVPVALAVALLAPVPFMRGLGLFALACAASGLALNAAALRGARSAYWPVGDTISAGVAPAPVAARSRALRRAPRLSFARMIALPRALLYFPGRFPVRMASHA